MSILDTLAVALGYEYDASSIEAFNRLTENTSRLLKGLSVAAIGAATSLTLMAISQSRNALQQQRLGDNIGASRAEIEAFSRVSKDLTGSSGAATSLLGMLSDMNDAYAAMEAPNEKFLQGLNLLGISYMDFVNMDIEGQMFAIARGMQSVDRGTQRAAKSLMGFNNEQQTFFLGLNQAEYEAEKPTQAAIRQAEALEKMFNKLSNTLNDIVASLSVELLPPITDFLEDVIELLPDAIKGFEALFKLITSVGAIVINMFKSIDSFLGGAISKIGSFLKSTAVKGLVKIFEIVDPDNLRKNNATSNSIAPSSQNNIRQENNIEIKVSSNAPANEVGRSIAENTSKEIQRLAERSYTGVVA